METISTGAVKSDAKRRKPEATRARLLAAARAEFAHRGLEGARVDDIARKAGVNKQLVYHHFGNKDDLYRHVLEWVYSEIRDQELRLDLDSLAPVPAMERFIEFSFDYLAENRDFVALLTDENIHKGRHMKDIEELRLLHTPLIEVLDSILKRGKREGKFRGGIDPEQLYISIAALGFFYFNNIYTLSAIFEASLSTPNAIARRRDHVVELVMQAIRS